jgi:dinuclear metal center YbgI/SA1388 family protein
MASRDEIVAFADSLLEVERWPEYGTPGLQVLGAAEVERVVCGVSCSKELFERAAAVGADMVLVHHGLFWRNEPLVVDRRLRGRLEELFAADMSLVAYHLALDAHPELGNNALLARRLGAVRTGEFIGLGAACGFDEPVSIEQLTRRVRDVVGRDPLVFPCGPAEIRRAAIVTGAGGHDLVRAAHEGFDVLVTGEPEEPSLATARELGIHLIAAGHYASERLGVQALAARIAETFGVDWEFVEVENPV